LQRRKRHIIISWRTSMLNCKILNSIISMSIVTFCHGYRRIANRSWMLCLAKQCPTFPKFCIVRVTPLARHRSTEMGHPTYLVSDSAVRHKLQHNTGCFTFCITVFKLHIMDVQFQIYQRLHGPYFTYLLLFHEI
jgi:hypothetical protein